MRLLLIPAFILFVSTRSFSQKNIDVLHYKFELEVNDKNDTIYGKTEITIKFLQNATFFTIQLANQNDKGQGMILDEIKSLTGATIKNYKRNPDDIAINLSQAQKQNDSVVYSIRYHGIPKNGLIISENVHGDRTFFGDNWPDRAHHWLPCVDDPGDKASLEFWVIAPVKYKVIANGLLQQEKNLVDGQKLTVWKEDIPLPTKVMVIGLAKFAVKKYADSPANIPVTAWIFSKDSATGFRNYAPSPSIVKFFSNYVGAYPYKKLANVQSRTMFGGMENASSIFYFEESGFTNKSVEALLAHEIAHQWFGDMVTEKKYSHIWLSEGFATYMTDLYLEFKYGRDSLNKRMKNERETVLGFNTSDAVIDSTSTGLSLLNANEYQKGAWILHMLRRQIGDSAFRLVIRRYYDQFKGKNADTEDFRAVVESVTGKDFKPFFQQWLYTPGHPKLEMKWDYNKKNKVVTVIINQIQNQPFSFPLEISLQTRSGRKKNFTFNVSQQTTVFKLDFKEEPVTKIVLDPMVNLLFEQK